MEEVTGIKYLGDKLSRECWGKSKLKDKLLHFMSPTTKKEAQFLVGLCEFWRQYITRLGKMFWPISWCYKGLTAVCEA